MELHNRPGATLGECAFDKYRAWMCWIGILPNRKVGVLLHKPILPLRFCKRSPSPKGLFLLLQGRKFSSANSLFTMSDNSIPSTCVGSMSEHPVIPPPSSSDRCRTLVLCFDGTGDQFDANVSGYCC